jgi:CheY-like chemotaxis protein
MEFSAGTGHERALISAGGAETLEVVARELVQIVARDALVPGLDGRELVEEVLRLPR